MYQSKLNVFCVSLNEIISHCLQHTGNSTCGLWWKKTAGTGKPKAECSLADYMNVHFSCKAQFRVMFYEICMVGFNCQNLQWRLGRHFISYKATQCNSSREGLYVRLSICNAPNKNCVVILNLDTIILKGHRKWDTNTCDFRLSVSTCGLDFWPW